jgi:hypothetical protein
LAIVKIEHAQNRAGERVERLIPDPSKFSIALDEAQDGTCIVEVVIHVVALGERRNDEKRKSLPISAAIQVGAYLWHAAQASFRATLQLRGLTGCQFGVVIRR